MLKIVWEKLTLNFMFQALFTADKYSIDTCHMPQEYTIAFIYITFILIVLLKSCKIKQHLQFINIKQYINKKY